MSAAPGRPEQARTAGEAEGTPVSLAGAPSPAAPARAASPAGRLVLRAKRMEIRAARRLAERIALVDALRQCIHALQHERGASSVYLASGGERFAQERLQAIADGAPALAAIGALLAAQGDAIDEPERAQADADLDAPMLCRMAWVLLGLEALPAQRAAVQARQVDAPAAIAAYGVLIASLVQLLSHVADASLLPGVSRPLVALLHLVQAKEAAGQERAAGAQMCASGHADAALQERLAHLIDAQERGLSVFAGFADPALHAEWDALQLGPGVARLERLRRVLCSARPGAALDGVASDDWFATTSARMGVLAGFEAALVRQLRSECARHAAEAEQALQDAGGLLLRLRAQPPGAAAAPVAEVLPAEAAALQELLQAQAERLARTEMELQAAHRALSERKVIERAKGVLMARLGLSEEAAFRLLQKTSMNQNRRLLEVAEATLAFPGLVG